MNRTYIRCRRIGGQIFRKASCKDDNGFTMLEVVAAIGILSITVIPLMGFLLDAMLIHVRREQEIRAAFLAQQKLEEVKSKAVYDFTYVYNELATDFPPPDSKFKYAVIDNTISDIKEITVRVWYDENDNDSIDPDEQQMELNTKVARRR